MVRVWPKCWQAVGGPWDRIWDFVALVWPIRSRVITTKVFVLCPTGQGCLLCAFWGTGDSERFTQDSGCLLDVWEDSRSLLCARENRAGVSIVCLLHGAQEDLICFIHDISILKVYIAYIYICIYNTQLIFMWVIFECITTMEMPNLKL